MEVGSFHDILSCYCWSIGSTNHHLQMRCLALEFCCSIQIIRNFPGVLSCITHILFVYNTSCVALGVRKLGCLGKYYQNTIFYKKKKNTTVQCFYRFAQHALLSSVGFRCFIKQPDRLCGLFSSLGQCCPGKRSRGLREWKHGKEGDRNQTDHLRETRQGYMSSVKWREERKAPKNSGGSYRSKWIRLRGWVIMLKHLARSYFRAVHGAFRKGQISSIKTSSRLGKWNLA